MFTASTRTTVRSTLKGYQWSTKYHPTLFNSLIVSKHSARPMTRSMSYCRQDNTGSLAALFTLPGAGLWLGAVYKISQDPYNDAVHEITQYCPFITFGTIFCFPPCVVAWWIGYIGLKRKYRNN